MLTYKDLVYNSRTKNGTINMFIKDIPNMFIVYSNKISGITIIYFDPRPGYYSANVLQIRREINIVIDKLNKETKMSIVDEVNKFFINNEHQIITTTF